MRAPRVTNKQLAVLLEFMKNHTEFCFVKPTGHDGRAEAEHLWKELSDILNSVKGPQKSTTKWHKTWVDWKCNVRTKAARMRAEQAVGINTNVALTALEEQLLSFIDSDSNMSRSTERDVYEEEIILDENDVDENYVDEDSDVDKLDLWEDDINIEDHHNNEAREMMKLPNAEQTAGHSKRKQQGYKRKHTSNSHQDEEEVCSSKRLKSLFIGQQMQTIAMREIASTLEALVTASVNKNSLKEKQLALYERQVIAEEKRLKIEERKAMAQELLTRQLKYFLQGKERVS